MRDTNDSSEATENSVFGRFTKIAKTAITETIKETIKEVERAPHPADLAGEFESSSPKVEKADTKPSNEILEQLRIGGGALAKRVAEQALHEVGNKILSEFESAADRQRAKINEDIRQHRDSFVKDAERLSGRITRSSIFAACIIAAGPIGLAIVLLLKH